MAEQYALARMFSEKLATFGDRARGFMPADAVADAFMGATLHAAGMYLPREKVAEWLRRLADELEKPDDSAKAH